MDIVQIVLIGIVASLLYVILKDVNPSFAFFLVVVTGVGLFLLIIRQVGAIFELIDTLGQKANLDSFFLSTILKIIAIAYIAELGIQMTKDAGLGSVAAKIELAAKISILIMAVPIIKALLEAVLNFLPA